MWGALAALGGAALSYFGAQDQNEANIQNARDQMAFQERMSSTAYQRGMEDMRKAGLNPMLAYSHGGASSPGGAMPQVANKMEAAANTATSMMQTKLDMQRTAADVAKTNAETQKAQAETLNVFADTKLKSALDVVAQRDAELKSTNAKLLLDRLPSAEVESKIDQTWYGKAARYLDRLRGVASSAANSAVFLKALVK